MLFTMDETAAISLAIEHLSHNRTTRGELTVGDAVRRAELGFGVLQTFGSRGNAVQASVLFALHGGRTVADPVADLEALDSISLGQRTTGHA